MTFIYCSQNTYILNKLSLKKIVLRRWNGGKICPEKVGVLDAEMILVWSIG